MPGAVLFGQIPPPRRPPPTPAELPPGGQVAPGVPPPPGPVWPAGPLAPPPDRGVPLSLVERLLRGQESRRRTFPRGEPLQDDDRQPPPPRRDGHLGQLPQTGPAAGVPAPAPPVVVGPPESPPPGFQDGLGRLLGVAWDEVGEPAGLRLVTLIRDVALAPLVRVGAVGGEVASRIISTTAAEGEENHIARQNELNRLLRLGLLALRFVPAVGLGGPGATVGPQELADP